ncbi:hypothetical protein FRB93_008723 [Tulasnella sp. JGI-2019a]|nr:hypothetical protein FRB93_008723 [Tulasnella sp. JGI-2019a]
MFFILFSATLLLLAVNRLYRYVASRASLPYPPGPPGDFIIGNLRHMPSKYSWLIFTEWARKYGPINYINVAGEPILIINTQEAALDLLEKRSAIYSDRPRFVMACELGGLDRLVSLMSYCPEHRRQRKILAQALNPLVVARDYVPIQERFVHQLAKHLLDDPEDFLGHFDRCIGNMIQAITYGEDDDVDFVALGRINAMHIKRIVRGYIVEFLPWLKYIPQWFPGAQFHRDARASKEDLERTKWLPYNTVKAKAGNGTASPSYVLTALNAMKTAKAGDIDDHLISMTASALYSSGADSTAGSLSTLIFAMLLHPDVQARVQAELDGVFGAHLPSIASRDSTPYLNAVIMETFRWRPPVPVGIPHRLEQDDVYNGYFIPAGTRILVNVWAILQNEQRFPDSAKFDPDRFLFDSPPSQATSASRLDPVTTVLGYGRRACPGIHVVQSGLWITMATILYCFNIRPKVDSKTMKPMIPELEFTGNSLRYVRFPESCVRH